LTSNPGGFGQGVAQFIESFRNEQAAKKANAEKMFEKHAAMLAQGLPVDKKKMAKWAREADLHFDLDPQPQPPPPPQPQAMPQGMPPSPAAQAGMQQFQQGLPQRQGAEQAYIAANGGPSVPAQAEMQNFQQGMPQRQAAEQAYMQANRQPGMMSRIASAIGQATGAPQPPSQAQQMGLMKMLQDIEQRGIQSRETEGMKANLQKSVLEALNVINQGIQMELDPVTDPRMAKALRTIVMVGGASQNGKMDLDAIGKLMEIPGFREAFGPLTKRIDEEVKGKKEADMKDSLDKSFATTYGIPPDEMMAARKSGDYSSLKKYMGDDQVKDMQKAYMETKKMFPDASADAIGNWVAASTNPEASMEDKSKAFNALGDPLAKKKYDASEARANERQGFARSAEARAASRHDTSETKDSSRKKVDELFNAVMDRSMSTDPNFAYYNVDRLLWEVLQRSGEAGDYDKYVGDVQDRIKDLILTRDPRDASRSVEDYRETPSQSMDRSINHAMRK